MFPYCDASSLTIDKDYVVQQQRRRYVRLGSIVKAARTFQKTVITNDNRRITVGKLQEMAQVCASALRHGNIGKARELMEDVSGCLCCVVLPSRQLLCSARH
jgi:hypothetical protein